jgi:hypothetical protein
MFRWWRKSLLSEHLVLFLSAAYFAAMWPFTPGLAAPENLANIAFAMLPLLIVAIGQTFVLISRGIDLSVTSTIALASVTGALVMNADTGWLRGSVVAGASGTRRDARRRSAARFGQWRSHHASADAALYCHADDDDVFQRSRHLDNEIEKHLRPACRV